MRMIKLQLSLLLLPVLLLTGCSKDDLTQGQKSLEGEWSVNMILTDYGIDGAGNPIFKRETGALGSLTFSQNQVNYFFTRNDTVYSGDGEWDLHVEKVNSGFTKTNKWTLVIANDFIFDVIFDDETSNSEKDANAMEFTEYENVNGNYFHMELDKK